MTPAEHYEQAENYLAEAAVRFAEGKPNAPIHWLVGMAQVHAQLATVRTPEMARETWDMIQQAPKPGFHPLPKSEVP